MKAALDRSLEVGDVPTEDEEKAEAIRANLERELTGAIEKLKISVQSGSVPGARNHPLNWRHLLFVCPYLREYGLKIYDIWIGEDRLATITNNLNQVLSRRLKGMFFSPKSPMAHMRKVPKLFRMYEEDMDELEELDHEDLLDYVYGGLDLDFEEDNEPSAERILETMRLFQRAEITSLPKNYNFVPIKGRSPEKSLAILQEKAEFFVKHPEIPLYMRQILFAASETTVADIEAKKSAFDEAGIDLAHSAHFLHVLGKGHLKKSVNMLGQTLTSYEAICDKHAERAARVEALNNPLKEVKATRALLAKHLAAEHVPSIRAMQESSVDHATISRRIWRLLGQGELVTENVLDENYRYPRSLRRQNAAKAELEALGYPYETLVPHLKQITRPTTLVPKVRLMLELMGEIRFSLLYRREEYIRQQATKIQKKKGQRMGVKNRLRGFFEERGLEAPAWLLDLKQNSAILRNIDHIESKGIPFTARNLQRGFVHWSWVNLGPSELDRKINEQHFRLQASGRFAQLEALYDIDMEEMPPSISLKSPDHLWRYLRALHAADIDIEDINPSSFNQYGLGAFRDLLAQKLQRLENAGGYPSARQELFLDQYEVAGRAKNRYGWKDAYDTIPMLPRKIFEEVAHIISASGMNMLKVNACHQALQERAVQRERIIKRLLKAGATYAYLDTCLDEMSLHQLSKL